jgi:fumarate hydratase, class II
VFGNDHVVAFAGTQGNFELNVMFPVIGRNVLESINLLSNVVRVLVDKCIVGIVANVEKCRAYAESSPSIVTPLNKYIGYEEAARIAKQALKENKTIKTVVLERGHVANGTLTAEQLDAALDVLSMTHP